MTKEELKQVAIKMVSKGYIDYDSIKYCDDLYDATQDEIQECVEYVSEIIENGMKNFITPPTT